MRIENLLAQNTRRNGSKIFISTEWQKRTYNDLENRSNKIAVFLNSQKLKRGEIVAGIMPNCIELVELMFATAKAGLIFVPINSRLSKSEICTILEDCLPRAVFINVELFETLDATNINCLYNSILVTVGSSKPVFHGWGYENIIESSSTNHPKFNKYPDTDIWLVGYTSGTTGLPKGACLSHRSKSLCAIVEAHEFQTNSKDTALINTPMFHVHSLVNILILAAVGGSVYIAQSFDPEETLRIVEKNRITEISMVPTMYQRILEVYSKHQTDLNSIRLARSTGASLSSELGTAIQEMIPENSLNVLYGATEAGPVSNLFSDEFRMRNKSVGLPLFGVNLEVRADNGEKLDYGQTGEIFVRSPYIFSNYFRSNSLSQNGNYIRWISLGDKGTVEEDGFIFLNGRTGDVIISGGENISASEVEKILIEHPSVSEAAVIGLKDEKWGETPCAFIELKADTQAPSEEGQVSR